MLCSRVSHGGGVMDIYWTCGPLGYVGQTMITICPDDVLNILIGAVVIIGMVLLGKFVIDNFRGGPGPFDLEGK